MSTITINNFSSNSINIEKEIIDLQTNPEIQKKFEEKYNLLKKVRSISDNNSSIKLSIDNGIVACEKLTFEPNSYKD